MPDMRERAEGDEGAEHQEVAMRKVDDAHDAEHEVEAEADQAEIEPEQHAGDERIDQHQRLGSRRQRATSANCRHGRG